MCCKSNGVDWCKHTLEQSPFLDQSHSLQIALAFTMATNNESTSSQNVAASIVAVEIDENDIPGAALSTPLERYTVPQLKW